MQRKGVQQRMNQLIVISKSFDCRRADTKGPPAAVGGSAGPDSTPHEQGLAHSPEGLHMLRAKHIMLLAGLSPKQPEQLCLAPSTADISVRQEQHIPNRDTCRTPDTSMLMTKGNKPTET